MAGLHFDITGDNTDFMNKLKQTENGIRNTSKSIEQSGMSIEAMFGKLSKAAAGLGVAFSAQQFVTQMAKVRGEFQQLEVAFETMLGSTEKASALMAQMTRTAAVTPFGLQDVAGGAKQLLAYGVEAEKVNETLVRLGDIAAGLSIPLNDLVYLYGTTMTQGRMFTQDLRQFQGRGIPLADELAKQFGVTKDKVGELVTAGKVGFAEMEKAIVSMTSEGGKFGGLMEAQSKTITGQLSNIEDAIDGMFNEIGKSSEGAINLALSGVSTLIENYEKVGEAIGVAVTAYGVYKAALLTGIAVQRAESAIVAEAAVQKSLAALAGHTLTASQAKGAAMSTLYAAAQAKVAASLKAVALATVANPYVLIAAAITGVVYSLYKISTAETEAEKAVKRHAEEEKKLNGIYEEKKNTINSLIDVIRDETETEYEKAKAYEELKRLSPELTSAYTREQIAIMELVKVEKVLNEERDKANYNRLVKKLETYTETIKKQKSQLENLKKSGSAGIDPSYVLSLAESIEKTEADLKVAKNQIKEIDKIKKEAEENSKPIEVRLVEAKSNREQILQEYLAAKMALQKAHEDLKNMPFAVIPFNVQTRFATAQQALKESDDNISRLENVSKSETYQEAFNKAEKDWKDKKKALEDAKKKNLADYEKAKTDLEEAEKTFKSLGGDTTGKEKKKSDKEAENAKKRSEELLNIRRQNQQDEINLMKEGSEKKIAQIELDYQRELDAIERQRQEWKKAQNGVLTDEQQAALGMSIVLAEDTRNNGLAKVEKEDTEAAKKAMNDYLKEYGNYLQKREAIINDYNERISNATTEGERLTLREEMKRELAELDEAAQGTTSTIAQLFEDMSDRTIAEMREIADEAETILAYLKTGFWEEVKDENGKGTGKDAFGFTKELFDKIRNDPEKVKAIGDGIKEVREKADEAEPIFKKMGKAFKGLFGDEKDFDENISTIIEGVGQVNQAMEFLGGTLSQISEAFGGNFLGGIAEGIGVATEAVNGAMSGAQAGAVFGPWGAAAGAAIGLVGSLTSSLSKLHDKKHEKTIQRIQEQIEVLEKTYDKLGDEIEKAYSNDASNLIKDQNKLLEQQKVLIQQQIREEEEKKKTDNDRIKEWKQQIEDINKTIEDNKEAAVDAIFGNDLKSAIEDFTSAYVDAWSAGEDKAKSAKDMVKTMIKNMITESIKAAASDPMKAIREKLLQFWSDEYISGWEQDYLNKMATDLQKELDSKFGWADSFLGNDSAYSQEASGKSFETMTQEQAGVLEGRFTALQISNEEIKNQMIQSVVLYTQMLTLTSQSNSILNDILVQHAISNGYLADLVKYSKVMSQFGEKIDKIVENTQNL